MFKNLNISWWSVGRTVMTIIIAMFLTSLLFVNPSATSLKELLSQKEKAINSKVDAFEKQLTELKDSVKVLKNSQVPVVKTEPAEVVKKDSTKTPAVKTPAVPSKRKTIF